MQLDLATEVETQLPHICTVLIYSIVLSKFVILFIAPLIYLSLSPIHSPKKGIYILSRQSEDHVIQKLVGQKNDL
jgi:hypothetical protein